MSGARPPAADDSDPGRTIADLDDDELLAALRQVLDDSRPPQWSVDLAKASFRLRMADAELAALTEDSELAGAASVTRSGGAPRLAVFDAPSLSVEIEVTQQPRTGSFRLLGQLSPPAPARVMTRRATAGTTVTADAMGRFMLGELPSGPLSLAIEVDGQPPVVTDWITIRQPC